MKIAVVGGGWAGMAAAVTATLAGHHATVFEAAHALGGRARALNGTLPDGSPVLLDNGQHILIGAYTETLRLMQLVGANPANTLLRLPLTLQFPDGKGLVLTHWPSPLDAVGGILTARGWDWRDKWSLLKAATGWQLRGFQCDSQTTVADLCRTLTPTVLQTMIDPLCVSALNTPAHRASGQVFLTVLRDSLFAGTGSSNLLLPRVDLSALFPQAAAHWLESHGGAVALGQRVDHLLCNNDGQWLINGTPFDAVVWATSSSNAAKTLLECAQTASESIASAIRSWVATAQSLQFECITTVYAHAPGARLPQPMLALRSDAGAAPAQFAFDRGQLGGPAGLLALVVSASTRDRAELQSQALAQAQSQLAPFLRGQTLHPVQTVVEKRATFACTPGLKRPSQSIAAGLVVCGDYVAGPYPATLEGAVRSAAQAISLLETL